MARPPELDLGGGDVVAGPGARQGGQPGVARDGEADLDPRVGPVVQVAPVPAPHLAPLLVQAGGPARERRLDALGEAGLPRAVAPHDEGDARLRGQRQTCLAADAAKAADADGVEEHPLVRVRIGGGAGGLRRGGAQCLAQECPGRLGKRRAFEAGGQPGERRGGASAMIDLMVRCVRLALFGVFRHGALRPPWSVPWAGRLVR